jgi:hypothetical protein
MMAEASTSSEGQATPVAPRFAGALVSAMIRIFLAVVVAGLLLLAVAVLMLGVYPPAPHTQSVEKVVPNDKFQTH